MPDGSLRVAWISDFPLEWLDGLPAPLDQLPRQHPLSWKRVLLSELETDPRLDIHIIVLRKEVARSVTFTRGRVTFHVIKYLAGMRVPSLYWADTILIRRVLAKIKPDLIHAWGNERGAGLVAHRLGYPYLLTVQGIYADIVAHGGLTTTPRMRVMVYLEALSLRRARHVSVESAYAARYLRQTYPQVLVHPIEHAPARVFYGVERRPSETLTLLSVGTVGLAKGSDILLRALDRLDRSFDALFVGAVDHAFVDPILATLNPRVRERIRFEAALSPAQVAAEMARATMLVIATRAENSPNVVKEAAVIGLPVVATDVGGIPEHITHDENGVLCRPGSVDAFARALAHACAHPLFSRGEVGPDALARVRSQLSPEQMARQFVRAYFTAAAR